ncbi:hypothetical protein K470DRAFT_208295 [Piedraia hortae CBS 480.64]|uniref:Uncharacterized protein n=1 Tax=Piedraia hortae CBS 480.64 TaxID=1314780 RepID=A0A6A7CA97_9PEZI|nr:hypothetical protein K470DRAFT_208295 [Piedraia hortae CBS 480.64]
MSSTGIPSNMPAMVLPPGGMPEVGPNKTLIQIGFNYELNYPFVIGADLATNQIFTYLPRGVAYGLEIPDGDVQMKGLLPYDTRASLHYITTLAQAYIPTDRLTMLQQDLCKTTSKFYHHPNSTVRELMLMINCSISVNPGSSVAGAQSSNPAATASSPAGEGAPIGADSGKSMPIKGTSVGISVGAIAGAAVYAATMFYVARRYRQRRQRHGRADSMPEMSHTEGMGMYGAGAGQERGSRQSGSTNGRSVREQGISHPIQAGNSLGWD